MVTTLAVLTFALSVFMMPAPAQYLRLEIAEKSERIGIPAAKPEPTKRIADDPRRIFQRITGEAVAERRLAARQLAWDADEIPQPVDARLILTNLDLDEEQEVILVLPGGPWATIAFVFDHQKAGWTQVGSFDYWWHWDANRAERLIELREIVSNGRKDILVRTQAGGTGMAETDLAIYRMLDGKLYRVFNTIEATYHTVCCGTLDTGSVIEDEREISFPDESESGRYIVVRHSSRKYPPDEGSSKPTTVRTRLVSCTAYRWTPEKFTFVPDKSAAPKFCGVK